jgi:hypothetical protein
MYSWPVPTISGLKFSPSLAFNKIEHFSKVSLFKIIVRGPLKLDPYPDYKGLSERQ